LYQTLIDYDVPLADYAPTFESLAERVGTALASLAETGSFPAVDDITELDQEVSRATFLGNRNISDDELSNPGVLVHLGALLNEYDKTVVQSANQLRTYITNRLLLESDNKDPRIRMKALEMLGKISDVGLFTDKTEITMRHRPTEELEQMLRERLTRVIEAEVVPDTPAPAKMALDLDEIAPQDDGTDA
jgi:hypothetical protein